MLEVESWIKSTSRRDHKEKIGSTLRFPVEHPPSAHFQMWKEALLSIAAGIDVRVRDFTLDGHKTWDGDWMRMTRILPGRDCFTLKVR